MLERKRFWFLAFFFLVALCWRLYNSFFDDTNYDGFVYMMFARSMAQGHWATPFIGKGILFHYDPLYPFAIHLFSFLTGETYTAARLVNIIAGSVLVFPVYGFTRDIYGVRAAVFAASLVVVNPLLVDLSANVYSEPLYVLFGVTAIWFLWKSWTGRSWPWLIAGVAMMLLAAYTRTQAMALFLSAIMGLAAVMVLFERSWDLKKALMLGVAAAVFFVGVYPMTRHVSSIQDTSEVGSKIAQELYKKINLFEEKAWHTWERQLSEEGDRLVWIKMASKYGATWPVRFHSDVYAKRALRDFWFFFYQLFKNRIMPALIMVPFVIQIVVDRYNRDYRKGMGLYFIAIILGSVASLALIAVTLHRYMVIVIPLIIIPAGAGMHSFELLLHKFLDKSEVPAWVFKYAPAGILLAALVSYPHTKRNDLDDYERPDDMDRRVARWAETYLDKDKPEIIMAPTTGVPYFTGDYFYLLPMDTPERIGNYARKQGADYVLMDDWYLSLLDPASQEIWTKGKLDHFGLERLDYMGFTREDNSWDRRVLFKVVPPSGAEEPESLDPELLSGFREGLGEEDRPDKLRPNIILVSLDSLRADHLGCMGYFRNTSPSLDLLAKNGLLFENAYSQSPKSAPSHMTMFTGQYPSQHGAHYRDLGGRRSPVYLENSSMTVAEILSKSGYRTGAWTGGGEMAAEPGFNRGFDFYRESLDTLSEEKIELALSWLESNRDAPCFLFLHTFQLDDPYLPPRPYNRMYDPDYEGWIMDDRDEVNALADDSDREALHRAFWKGRLDGGGKVDPAKVGEQDLIHLRALYDGGIRYTDEVLGRMVSRLIESGLMKDTVIVVTSSRGTEFKDHGRMLNSQMYRETLRVPLIIYGPGFIKDSARVDRLVGLVDLGPTILNLAGVKVPEQFCGEDLSDPFNWEGPSVVLSEDPWSFDSPHRVIRDNDYTLYDKGGNRPELYFRRIDETEKDNIARERKDERERMSALLEGFLEKIDKDAFSGYIDNEGPTKLGSLKDRKYVSD